MIATTTLVLLAVAMAHAQDKPERRTGDKGGVCSGEKDGSACLDRCDGINREEAKARCQMGCSKIADEATKVCERIAAGSEERKEKFEEAKAKVQAKAEEGRAKLEESIANGTFKETCVEKICNNAPEMVDVEECTATCEGITSAEEARETFKAAADKVQSKARERLNAAREMGMEKAAAAKEKLKEAIEARRATFSENKLKLAEKLDEKKAEAAVKSEERRAAAEVRREQLAELKEQFEAAETQEEKDAIKEDVKELAQERKEALKEVASELSGKRKALLKKAIANAKMNGEDSEERREARRFFIAKIKAATPEERKAMLEELKEKLKEIAPEAEVDEEEDDDGERKRAAGGNVVAVVPCEDELCALETSTAVAEVANAEQDVDITEMAAVEVEEAEEEDPEIDAILNQVASEETEQVDNKPSEETEQVDNKPVVASNTADSDTQVEEKPEEKENTMDEENSSKAMVLSIAAIVAAFFAL